MNFDRRDSNPYAPSDVEENGEREKALAYARKRLKDGAGPGSIKFRLVRWGIPSGLASEIVQLAVDERKRKERLANLIAVAVILVIFGPIVAQIVVVGPSFK